jgi:Uma2 family endonuclease
MTTALLELEAPILMDDDGYELIDGIPKEKDMGAQAEAVNFDFGLMLGNFVKLHHLGRCFGSNTAYQCFPGRPAHFRKPDTSFIARDRLPPGPLPTGHLTIAPDLVVEVVSPKNTYEEIEEKIAEYREAGVKLIWVIRPRTKTAMVHRLDGTVAEIPADGFLDGETVVPGFRCRLADVFEAC